MNKIKSILLIITLFLFTSLFGQKPAYSIKIKVNNSPDTMMLLCYYFGNNQYIKDTAKLDKKTRYFTFQGKEALPGGIYLAVMQNRKYFEMVVDREQNFTMETDTNALVKNMKIKGSEDNVRFYEYLNFLDKQQKRQEELVEARKKVEDNKDSVAFWDKKILDIGEEVKQYKLNFIEKYPDAMMSKVFKASKEPEIPDFPLLENGRKDSIRIYHYYKNHYWDEFDFTDDRILRTPVFNQKLKTYFTQIVLQHPDTLIVVADWLVSQTGGNKETFKYIVWYITYQSETSNIMGMDKLFVHMVDNYYKTGQAYWVTPTILKQLSERADQLKNILIGVKAPNLLMQDSTGKPVSLYSIKAKMTVIYFWDPTCGHCQKETPLLRNWYNDTAKAKGVEVFAVGCEEEEARWRKYIRDNKLNWINVHDPNNWTNFRKIYDIKSTPIIYLLDENKIIKAKRLSLEQLKEFVDRELDPDKKTDKK